MQTIFKYISQHGAWAVSYTHLDVYKRQDHAYPQIRTFRQNRGGVTEARNYGMRKATGQYLFFMDADDDLPAQSLEVLVERAVETRADITAGTTLHLTEKRELIARMN